MIKADLIDANLWLKTNDCEPIVPAPTDIAELDHPPLFIIIFGIDITIFCTS